MLKWIQEQRSGWVNKGVRRTPDLSAEAKGMPNSTPQLKGSGTSLRGEMKGERNSSGGGIGEIRELEDEVRQAYLEDASARSKGGKRDEEDDGQYHVEYKGGLVVLHYPTPAE
ncbi:hypothetical protein EON65_48455 [archaeon]|nr:MAG: hypothetical protein EON65_48455 [archaeon]